MGSMVVACLATLAGCAVPFAGVGDPKASDILEQAERDHSEIPLLVPVTLPEGWRLDSTNSQTADGRSIARELTFISKASDEFPVALCIQNENDPLERCPQAHQSGNPAAQRVEGMIAVWSYIGSDVKSPGTWNGIRVTRQWRTLSWATE